MNWLKHLCRRQPESREAELLYEARMKHIEHEAAAEHHGALSRMYAERIARIENNQKRAAR